MARFLHVFFEKGKTLAAVLKGVENAVFFPFVAVRAAAARIQVDSLSVWRHFLSAGAPLSLLSKKSI